MTARYCLAPLIACLALITWYWNDYQTTVAAQAPIHENLPDGRQLLFADADSYQWIMLAQTAAKTGNPLLLWRTHEITYDNAPKGRLQHWATPYLAYLIVLGKINQGIHGGSLNAAIENAALLANPLLIVLFGIPLIVLLAKTTEPLAGSLVGFICLIPPANAFLSAHPDHHGILQICLILSILGAGKAFTTLKNRPHQNRWLILSGITTGVLLWHSAFTAVPLIAALTIAAAISTKKGEENPLWEIWANAAALTAFVAYLFEYVPFNLHLTLDINNPLYCAALWACGRLLQTQREYLNGKKTEKAWNILAILTLFLPALLLIVKGQEALHILNPFYSDYMKILAKTGEEMGGISISQLTPPHFLVVALALAAIYKALEGNRQCLWALPIAIYGLAILLCFIRCIPLGFAALLIVTLFTWEKSGFPKNLLPMLLLPTALASYQDHKLYFAFPNSRDLADEIRYFNKTPENPVVLSIPDHNLPLAYYLNGRSAGTSCWENFENLKTMHERMALPASPQAEALLKDVDILIANPKDTRHLRSAQLVFGNKPLTGRPLWENFQFNNVQLPVPQPWKELKLEVAPYRVWLNANR